MVVIVVVVVVAVVVLILLLVLMHCVSMLLQSGNSTDHNCNTFANV